MLRYYFVMLSLSIAVTACDDNRVDPDAASQDASTRSDGGPPTVTLTVEVRGTGSVTSTPAGIDCGASCDLELAVGTTVTLNAMADTDAQFAQWRGACVDSVEATCEVTLEEDLTITAVFGGSERHDLTVTVSGDEDSSITSTPAGIDCPGTCSADFVEGTEITLTPELGIRSRIQSWAGDGASCDGAACAVTMDADRSVDLTVEEVPVVRFSESDRDGSAVLSADRLSVMFQNSVGLAGGVRTDRSVAPESGVYYFEVTTHTPYRENVSFGIATSDTRLDENTYAGIDDNSYGVSRGGVRYRDIFQGVVPIVDTYGFIVDYRGTSPTVYLIGDEGSGAALLRTDTLTTISAPIFIFAAGAIRRMAYRELSINPGNDLTHHPLQYDPAAVLRETLPEVADALVLGWGNSFSPELEESPSFIEVTEDATVAAGTEVTVSARVTDVESGELTDSIAWEVLSSPYNSDRISATGGSITFTANAVGRHLVRARVADPRREQIVERTVVITVDGPVAQFDPVRLQLEPGLSGAGIELATNGLQAHWTGAGKMGVRANQSLYGEFWYFEMQRLVDVVPVHPNQGGGLVIGGTDLNPYEWDDIGASMSINVSGGYWHNLIPVTDFLSRLPSDPDGISYYGFAVDYRGDYPIVYLIVDDVVDEVIEMTDVTTEIYPLLYGDPIDESSSGEFDMAANFGATAFHYDATAVLTAHGVDTTEFEEGWGDVNTD